MPDCRNVLAATVAVLGLALSTAAQAQGYPAKPVKLVVPYPPGGPTDIVARVVGQKLSAQGFAAAWNTPEAFSAFPQVEVDKWSAVVKSSGTTVD